MARVAHTCTHALYITTCTCVCIIFQSQIYGHYGQQESLFAPSGEWDPPTHCVALYNYDKFNPNDMPLK